MDLTFRKPAKQLAYRKRHLALTSIEQVQLRKMKRLFLLFSIGLKNGNHDPKTLGKFKKCMKLIAVRYLGIVVDPTYGRIAPAWRDD